VYGLSESPKSGTHKVCQNKQINNNKKQTKKIGNYRQNKEKKTKSNKPQNIYKLQPVSHRKNGAKGGMDLDGSGE
jgi:hypothetical protein